MGLAPPPPPLRVGPWLTCGAVLCPHQGNTDVASVPTYPKDGLGKHVSTPTPEKMNRCVGKDLTEEGSTGQSMLPMGVHEEIQVLLVSLVEKLQKMPLLCAFQLHCLDLPSTQKNVLLLPQGQNPHSSTWRL